MAKRATFLVLPLVFSSNSGGGKKGRKKKKEKKNAGKASKASKKPRKPSATADRVPVPKEILDLVGDDKGIEARASKANLNRVQVATKEEGVFQRNVEADCNFFFEHRKLRSEGWRFQPFYSS